MPAREFRQRIQGHRLRHAHRRILGKVYNRASKSARRGYLRMIGGTWNIIWGDVIAFARKQNFNANSQHEAMDIESRSGS
jgi:hypothetical protein